MKRLLKFLHWVFREHWIFTSLRSLFLGRTSKFLYIFLKNSKFSIFLSRNLYFFKTKLYFGEFKHKTISFLGFPVKKSGFSIWVPFGTDRFWKWQFLSYRALRRQLNLNLCIKLKLGLSGFYLDFFCLVYESLLKLLACWILSKFSLFQNVQNFRPKTAIRGLTALKKLFRGRESMVF